ncbi:MAG: hypothetical protein ABEJ76_03795 [Halanaeroarchaeum sp.]
MDDVSIGFETRADPPGVAIMDPIEGRRLRVRADVEGVESTPTETLRFPVDEAIQFEATTVAFEHLHHVVVWSAAQGPIETIEPDSRSAFDAGGYHLEISAPIKLYLAVDGPFAVEADPHDLAITFPSPTTVTLGARSYHEAPAATITIGDDPEDAMAAISTFSSSLKTTSPEVTFPTLRGHPPLIETGGERSIPSDLEPVRTGIGIEVPPNRRYVYPVAPLAYFLGATVEPGEKPRLVTEEGFEYRFDGDRWVEDEVARVLQHVFLLDAVVRGEGFYAQRVTERRAVDELLDRDLETLYDRPMHERVATYLQVDPAATAALGPRWAMTAYVPPTVDGAEILPHVVNELAVVRNPRGTRIEATRDRRSLDVPGERARAYLTGTDRRRLLVEPHRFDDSIEHVWFGDHVPLGATKGFLAAFERRLGRSGDPDGVAVAVVANGDRVGDGERLQSAYRVRDDLGFTMDAFVDATTQELRSVLASEYDFLHFVGETEPGGLAASDGTLSLADLETVNVSAFLLDADHSFDEAEWLARNEALGGIGTVGTVDEDAAIDVGRWIGTLLSMGFSLRSAVDVLRDVRSLGEQYVVVGNGNVDVAQSTSSMPACVDVCRDEPLEIAFNGYPSGVFRVGSTGSPHFENAEPFVAPGNGGQRFETNVGEFLERIDGSLCIVRADGNLFVDPAEAVGHLADADGAIDT